MIEYFRKLLRKSRHKKIVSQVGNIENKSVLDISCSNGEFISRLKENFSGNSYSGVDISHECVHQAKEGCSDSVFKVCDSNKIDFPDSSFDIVFSLLALHHYEDSKGFFREVSRVLKPSGTFYLVDIMPRNSFFQKIANRLGCSEPYHFEKYYTSNDVSKIAEGFGLKIVQDKSIPDFIWLRLLKIVCREQESNLHGLLH